MMCCWHLINMTWHSLTFRGNRMTFGGI